MPKFGHSSIEAKGLLFNRQRAGIWLSFNSRANPLQAGLPTTQLNKIAFPECIPN